jgi:hypothetical protein
MSTASRGIRQDTPENSAADIRAILHEEALEIGASYKEEINRKGIAADTDIYASLGGRNFHVSFSFVPLQLVRESFGSIGNGFIAADHQRWNLELLPKDIRTAPFSSPFRWGLYHENESYLTTPPSHILEGALLRKVLRDSLLPQPPSSP